MSKDQSAISSSSTQIESVSNVTSRSNKKHAPSTSGFDKFQIMKRKASESLSSLDGAAEKSVPIQSSQESVESTTAMPWGETIASRKRKLLQSSLVKAKPTNENDENSKEGPSSTTNPSKIRRSGGLSSLFAASELFKVEGNVKTEDVNEPTTSKRKRSLSPLAVGIFVLVSKQ